jgi:hypothetical protein
VGRAPDARKHILGSAANFEFGNDRPSSRVSDRSDKANDNIGPTKSDRFMAPSTRNDRTYKPY